jgi:hypothetical protein
VVSQLSSSLRAKGFVYAAYRNLVTEAAANVAREIRYPKHVQAINPENSG